MTSKTLSNNLLFNSLKQHLWLPTLISIGMLFSVIFPTLMTRNFDTNILYNGFIPTGAIFFSFITPFILFKYLLKKPQNDFYHSLPYKRTKLFCNNYVAGLILLLVPFTLIYALACLSSDTFSTQFLTIYLNILLIVFSIYSLSTLAIVIAGNMITTVLLALIFNIGIFTCAYFTDTLLSTLLITFHSSSLPINYYDLALYTTPILSAIDFNQSISLHIVITLLLIGCIGALLALLLYQKRPSENATQAIAITKLRTPIKYICIYIGAITIGTLCFMISKIFVFLIVGIILSTFLLNGILEVIFESELKACFKNIQYNFIFIICMLVALIGLQTDWLQYDHKFPEANEVESIILHSSYYGYNINYITLSETENIEDSISMFSQLIETLYTRGKSSTVNSSYYYLECTYNLKDGSSFSRHYPLLELTTSALYDDFESLLSTTEAILSANKYAELENFKDSTYTSTYTSFTIAQYIDKYNSYSYTIQTPKEQKNYEMLLDLISEEYLLLDDVYLQNAEPVFILTLYPENSAITYIDIYPCFEQTIEFLNSTYKGGSL